MISSHKNGAAPGVDTVSPKDRGTRVWFELPDLLIEAAGCVGAHSTSPEASPRLNAPEASESLPASTEAVSIPPQRGFFVPRELAARWGVCIDKVLNFIRSGELRAFNVAAKTSKRPRYRILLESVREFEEQTRAAAIPETPAPPAPSRRRKRDSATPARRTYF